MYIGRGAQVDTYLTIHKNIIRYFKIFDKMHTVKNVQFNDE